MKIFIQIKSFLYSFIIALLVQNLVFFPVSSFGAGQQFEFLLGQQRSTTGLLANGKVYFFEVGGSIPKAIYLNVACTSEAANPYTLDANGTALLFGNGNYRVVIKTSAGVTVYDRDNLKINDAWVPLTDGSYTETIKP